MFEGLAKLLQEEKNISNALFYLERKNWFVIAYLKFENSLDYRNYIKYKNLLNSGLSSDLIKERIEYYETYGDFSYMLYLEKSCEDVKKYLELRKLHDKVCDDIENYKEDRLSNNIERRKNRLWY